MNNKISSIISKIFVFGYIIFALVFVYSFFKTYSIANLGMMIFEASISLLLFLSLYSTGVSFLRLFRFNDLLLEEKLVFSFGIGIGIYVLIAFILGIFGLIINSIFYFILFLSLYLFKNEIFGLFTKVNRIFSNKRMNFNFWGFLILTSITVFLILGFVSSFVPPTYYDSLVYHLALPSKYILDKKISFVQENLYSNFPQNIELLWMVGLLIGDEVVPNIISFIISLLSLVSIFSFSKRFFNTKIGLFSIFFAVSAPTYLLLSPSSYVEAGLAFFSFLGMYSFFLFLYLKKGLNFTKISDLQYSTAPNEAIKYLVLSGIFCGLAFGTKYTGIITGIIINFFLLYLLLCRKLKMRYIVVFTSVVILLFLPWAVKNYLNVGNPFFPFFYNVIGFKNIAWTKTSAQGYFTGLVEYKHTGNILVELLKFPLEIATSATRYGGGIDILGDFGWAIIFLFIPLYFLIRNKSTQLKVLFGFFILHFLIWFSTRPVLRFLYPLYFVGCLIISNIVYDFALNKKNIYYRTIFIFVVLIFTFTNTVIYFLIQDKMQTFRVFFGAISREEYLASTLRNSPYLVFKYVNENLNNDAKIFFVGEQRSFYLKKKFVAYNVFAKNPLIEWANSSNNYLELIEKLKSEKFTHILYNKKEGERLHNYGIFDFDENGKKNWLELLNNLKLEYSENEVFLFRL